jgi:hypothetical protein
MPGATLDYRLAVTTDDDNPVNFGPEYGRLLPCPSCSVSGPSATIVSPSSVLDGGSVPNPVAVFVDLLGAAPATRLTGGNLDKDLFLALYHALENDPQPGLDFFRNGAYFAVVNESGDDDPDRSDAVPGGPDGDGYQSFFGAWFPDPTFFSWNYINPAFTSDGSGFSNPSELPPSIEAMLVATNGLGLNIEDPNWIQPFLSLWSAAANANLHHHLQSVPPSGQTGMLVTVDGNLLPATDWSYDASTNAVVFTASGAPANGAQIQIRYPIGCQ